MQKGGHENCAHFRIILYFMCSSRKNVRFVAILMPETGSRVKQWSHVCGVRLENLSTEFQKGGHVKLCSLQDYFYKL